MLWCCQEATLLRKHLYRNRLLTHLVGKAVLTSLPAGCGFSTATDIWLSVLPVDGGWGSSAHPKPVVIPKQKQDTSESLPTGGVLVLMTGITSFCLHVCACRHISLCSGRYAYYWNQELTRARSLLTGGPESKKPSPPGTQSSSDCHLPSAHFKSLTHTFQIEHLCVCGGCFS